VFNRSIPTIAELVDCDDDVLFNKVLDNPYHVLHNSVPNESVSNYALREADLTIENWSIKLASRLVESSFIVRMLCKDIY